ncbi:vesicular inhibitory amino acid transporter-like [Amphiura filiformis]|uniref:vesicular inhibitory amino acid transporter-like n=1 Tax=Amphiura filiformis TaxID=82378 RepID=UPI003B210697
MFLLALPYAVKNGGYWGLVALIAAAAITYYTGIILVQCLYETDPTTGIKRRVRDSYVDIATEVWGIYAAQIVHTAQFIELIMTCILYLVLCGDLLSNCFPGSGATTTMWTIVATFFVVPCAFLRDLKAVARLSLGNAVAHVIINVIVIGYCITHIGTWHWAQVKLKVDLKLFPVSMGIVIFSYTSHIFLPSLEGDMTDRSQFNTMLKWTHGLAGLFKALFAYVCFLTFGNATKDVITDNLPTAGFKGLVNFALVIKALLSYPLPYYAAAELLERAFFMGRPRTLFPSCFATDGCLNVWALFLRMLLALFTLTLAIYIPHFSLLMGLIGSFTGTMLSFVWPCWFHLKIKWYDIPNWQKVGNVCIMVGGAICGIIGIILSFKGLVDAFRGLNDDA